MAFREIKKDKRDLEGRIALGLGTDLGGYSIMLGGTSGPHLGSFSLIDILSHGRACALLNPYYTVLFAPVIQDQLKTVGAIFKEAGYIKEEIKNLRRKESGIGCGQRDDRLCKGSEFSNDPERGGCHPRTSRPDADGCKEPSAEDEAPEYANTHGCGKGRCGSIDEAGPGSGFYRGLELDSVNWLLANG